MSEEVSRMAAAAVDDIVKDLCDRCGLRQEWEGIGDEAIYAQIKKSWADIIESHVKPADGYRLPDPIRTTGSCAGCGQPIDNGKDEIFTFESTTGKLWHGHCAPKDEARPIIPPWLRELERMRRGQYFDNTPGSEAVRKSAALEALAKLRAVVLSGQGEADVPESVVKEMLISSVLHPKLGDTIVMNWDRAVCDRPNGWATQQSLMLSYIDAAGAGVCK